MNGNKIANKLKEYRIKNSLSKKAVAEKLGIAQFTYYKYENGENKLSLTVAIKICKLYNISLDELVGIERKLEDDPQIKTYADFLKYMKFMVFIDDKIFESQILSNNLDESTDICNIIIQNSIINGFLREFGKMLNVLKEKKISIEAFDLWFNSKIKTYEDILLPKTIDIKRHM